MRSFPYPIPEEKKVRVILDTDCAVKLTTRSDRTRTPESQDLRDRDLRRAFCRPFRP